MPDRCPNLNAHLDPNTSALALTLVGTLFTLIMTLNQILTLTLTLTLTLILTLILTYTLVIIPTSSLVWSSISAQPITPSKS